MCSVTRCISKFFHLPVNCVSSYMRKSFMHECTLAIWTFTFHKKIRLCKGDLEGKDFFAFMNFLIWKFNILLFFAGIVKSIAFCTLLLHFQKGWNHEVIFLHQITTQTFQRIGTAMTMQKAVDLTIPAKKRRKMNVLHNRSEFSGQKVYKYGL